MSQLSKPNPVIYALLPDMVTPGQCLDIIRLGTSQEGIESYTGTERSYDADIRRNRVHFFSHDQCAWLWQLLLSTVESLNHQFWRYDLDHIETLQFTRYDRVGDHYAAHIDGHGHAVSQRKLSFVLQLSDPAQYVGSELQLHSVNGEFYSLPKTPGTLIVFPSFTVHRVTAITQGCRYSLVGWVKGPPFR